MSRFEATCIFATAFDLAHAAPERRAQLLAERRAQPPTIVRAIGNVTGCRSGSACRFLELWRKQLVWIWVFYRHNERVK